MGFLVLLASSSASSSSIDVFPPSPHPLTPEVAEGWSPPLTVSPKGCLKARAGESARAGLFGEMAQQGAPLPRWARRLVARLGCDAGVVSAAQLGSDPWAWVEEGGGEEDDGAAAALETVLSVLRA